MKQRLRWYGVMWCKPERLHDCWRYWRAWYHTTSGLIEARTFGADRCAELQPI